MAVTKTLVFVYMRGLTLVSSFEITIKSKRGQSLDRPLLV